MNMRALRSAAVAGLVLVTAAACGNTVTTQQGLKIKDSDEVLTGVLDAVRKDNSAALQDGSTTISDKTACFFVKPSPDADTVTDEVACGPVRRLGWSDTRVWDTYGLKFQQNADGEVSATSDELREQGRAIDPGLLEGGQPAQAKDIPEPQAPTSPVTDTAALVPPQTVDKIAFSKLKKPWRIITPAATIEVTEKAEPEVLPSIVLPADERGTAPYYRPAEGQQVKAFKIKIGPPAEQGVPESDGEGDPVSLTTSMALTLGDGKVTIANVGTSADADSTDGDGAPQNWAIGCGDDDDYGDESPFPCDRTGSSEAVLVATVPAQGTVGLHATVNGDAQTLDLTSGKLTSSVSQVEYKRSTLTSEVGEQLRTSTKVSYTDFLDEKQTTTATWTWTIHKVGLSAFDPTRGWAPKGRAWLLVQTSDYDLSGERSYNFDEDDTQPTVTVGGKSYKPNKPADDSGWFGNNVDTYAFLVPDNVTTGTFNYSPRGTFKTGDEPIRYAAKAGSVDFTLQK